MPNEPVTFVVFCGDLVSYAIKKYLNIRYQFPHQKTIHRRTFHKTIGRAALVFRDRHADQFGELMVDAASTSVTADVESAIDYFDRFVERNFVGRVPLMELVAFCAFLVDLAVCCVENGRTDLVGDVVAESYDVYHAHVRPFFDVIGGWMALLRVSRDYLNYVESMESYGSLVASEKLTDSASSDQKDNNNLMHPSKSNYFSKNQISNDFLSTAVPMESLSSGVASEKWNDQTSAVALSIQNDNNEVVSRSKSNHVPKNQTVNRFPCYVMSMESVSSIVALENSNDSTAAAASSNETDNNELTSSSKSNHVPKNQTLNGFANSAACIDSILSKNSTSLDAEFMESHSRPATSENLALAIASTEQKDSNTIIYRFKQNHVSENQTLNGFEKFASECDVSGLSKRLIYSMESCGSLAASEKLTDSASADASSGQEDNKEVMCCSESNQVPENQTLDGFTNSSLDSGVSYLSKNSTGLYVENSLDILRRHKLICPGRFSSHVSSSDSDMLISSNESSDCSDQTMITNPAFGSKNELTVDGLVTKIRLQIPMSNKPYEAYIKRLSVQITPRNCGLYSSSNESEVCSNHRSVSSSLECMETMDTGNSGPSSLAEDICVDIGSLLSGES